MHMLGPKAALRRHEQDLLYSGAACNAHASPEVNTVGTAFLAEQKNLKGLRANYEDAEDGVIIAEAFTRAKDDTRDTTLVTIGRFADVLGEGDRTKLFKMKPSDIAQLGYAAESKEIHEILTRLREYPTDHPLRATYEPQLTAEQKTFERAEATNDDAERRLSSVRFTILNAKLANDTFREQQHAKLTLILGRREADKLFKTWRKDPPQEPPTT